MPAALKTQKKINLQELKTAFSEGLFDLSREKQDGRILRLELPLNGAWDVLGWLGAQTMTPRLYWSDRDKLLEIAGVGQADLLKGTGEIKHAHLLAAMRKELPSANVRYFGGMCFDTANTGNEWKDFGSYTFWLPRFELSIRLGKTIFACHLQADELTPERRLAIEEQFDQLDFSKPALKKDSFKTTKRTDFPDRAGWDKIAAKSIDALDKNTLEKIVLAKKSIFELVQPVKPAALLKELKNLTPNCFHFLFQPSDKQAFLGASPERLYRRDGRNLKTEAIAGTRPRGRSPHDDQLLKKELLDSPKELNEHRFVVEAIEKCLTPICRHISFDSDVSLVQLKDGQHLVTRFTAILKEKSSDADILRCLHPTPAVAGSPTDKAITMIKELEPFARGWYAGPVGWVGKNASEFAVAIRCGLLQDQKLSLFAGAGLVKGSTPEQEWQEIEHKLTNFVGILK